jgi:hypothetical protein
MYPNKIFLHEKESKALFRKLKKAKRESTPLYTENQLIKMRSDYIKHTKSKISVLCGRIGGLIRAQNLSPEERRSSARNAAECRWNKREVLRVA